MKYFIDTEFIEGFHKPLFGKRRHFIDLISIGIVCEDGREYYAISNEYSYSKADTWVKENVIDPLYLKTVHGDMRNHCSSENFHKSYGEQNSIIARQIKEFILHPWHLNRVDGFDYRSDPEFYAYYADYDWVVFCSLFGRMIDLPKGFPMYCNDLKQSLDEVCFDMAGGLRPRLTSDNLYTANYSPSDYLDLIKDHPDYPKQENEHSALDDARWNKKLYDFLQTI